MNDFLVFYMYQGGFGRMIISASIEDVTAQQLLKWEKRIAREAGRRKVSIVNIVKLAKELHG